MHPQGCGLSQEARPPCATTGLWQATLRSGERRKGLRLCRRAGLVRTETAAWDARKLASYLQMSWRPGVPLPRCLNHSPTPTSRHTREAIRRARCHPGARTRDRMQKRPPLSENGPGSRLRRVRDDAFSSSRGCAYRLRHWIAPRTQAMPGMEHIGSPSVRWQTTQPSVHSAQGTSGPDADETGLGFTPGARWASVTVPIATAAIAAKPIQSSRAVTRTPSTLPSPPRRRRCATRQTA